MVPVLMTTTAAMVNDVSKPMLTELDFASKSKTNMVWIQSSKTMTTMEELGMGRSFLAVCSPQIVRMDTLVIRKQVI